MAYLLEAEVRERKGEEMASKRSRFDSRVTAYGDKGDFRASNEDVHLMIRATAGGARHTALIVIDGFSKRDGRGAAVALSAARTARRRLRPLLRAYEDPTVSVRELFEEIHERTDGELSGAAMALALIDEDASVAYVAALGDVVVSHCDSNGTASVCPKLNLHLRGERLWGCFGDSENSEWHSREPEIGAIRLLPNGGSALVVACDGAFGQLSDADVESQAKRYAAWALEGADARTIVEHARHILRSTDNVTAIAWRSG